MKKSVTAANRLMALFQGFAGAHGTHGTPDRDPDGLKWNIKKTAKTMRQRVTPELWRTHLEGKYPLGVIPIREDNSCSWGSIDFDEYDVDILELVARVDATKLPLVPCRSKSGGLHLFLFLEKPEPAGDVQGVLREVAASLGMAQCEIFPKQTKIILERNDLGSWMIMPYYGDDFSGKLKMQFGIKKTGAEMTLGEFVDRAEASRTTVERLSASIPTRKVLPFPDKKKKRKNADNQSKDDFSNGPPCLQHLAAAGVQKDGRKRTLFMMALYFKRSDASGWKELLDAANQRMFTPPLPASEVTGVINSVEKKDYEYTCKEEPMRSHCDSTLCKMRKFGVGRGGEYPVITSLSKLETDPPVWFADVEGERLELSTDELYEYTRFLRVCMNRVNKCFKLIRQDAWLSILSEAMQKLEPLEAPSDVGSEGSFQELLEEFLTNRARGSRPEDLLSGRPFESEDGRHYFTLRALTRYLRQENMRELTRGQITTRIRKLQGGHHFFNIKNNRGVNCWWVPISAVTPTLAIAPPEIEENPI